MCRSLLAILRCSILILGCVCAPIPTSMGQGSTTDKLETKKMLQEHRSSTSKSVQKNEIVEPKCDWCFDPIQEVPQDMTITNPTNPKFNYDSDEYYNNVYSKTGIDAPDIHREPGKESSWTAETINRFKVTTEKSKTAKTSVASLKKGITVTTTKIISTVAAVTEKAASMVSAMTQNGKVLAKNTGIDVGISMDSSKK